MLNLDAIKKSFPDIADFAVDWFQGHAEGEAALQQVLARSTREEDVQAVFEQHPVLLARLVGGGHGRWVIPKKRLGSEYVTDFLVGEKSSIGFEWVAVELERPVHKMFTKNGDPSRELNHAIRQITDWRAWLKDNQNYAARSRQENGLGLTDIASDVPGLVLIGRRAGTSRDTNARRRQMGNQSGIQIHSFDWILGATEALSHVDP